MRNFLQFSFGIQEFFIFFMIFWTFIFELNVSSYLPILYFQKLILSQMKVPYVCQFLRKFQLEIIFLCLHPNQKCQSKISKNSRLPCSRGIPTVYFNRRVNCQPSFPASAIVAEPPRISIPLNYIFSRKFLQFSLKSYDFRQKSQIFHFFIIF